MSHETRQSLSSESPCLPGRTTGALGSLALAHLLQQNQARAASSASKTFKPLTSRKASADSVICLFQHGGPSQMDLFDHKPVLNERDGQPYQGELEIHFTAQQGNILGSPFRFIPCGQSGIELSELLPHTANIVDDFTLIRSLTTESVDHESALRLIHSGKLQAGNPTWGSWLIYALGSANQNLPAYMVLSDPAGMPTDSVHNWRRGLATGHFPRHRAAFRLCGFAQLKNTRRCYGRRPRCPIEIFGRTQPRAYASVSRQYRTGKSY